MNEENYLSLARAATEGRNYSEAHRYWTLSLEANPRNLEAWIGKANAATWLPNFFEEGVKDAISCLEQAIALGLTEENQKEAASVAYLVADFYFDRANTIYLRLLAGGSDSDALRRRLYIESTMLFTGRQLLDLAWQLEKSTERAKTIIQLCNAYRKRFGRYAGDFIDRVIQECNTWVTQNDPRAAQTLPRATSKPACFIATASYRTGDHPRVESLREFRDTFLLSRKSGRLFVSAYYRLSPPVARLIEGNVWLQAISRILLVSPVYTISQWLAKRRDGGQ